MAFGLVTSIDLNVDDIKEAAYRQFEDSIARVPDSVRARMTPDRIELLRMVYLDGWIEGILWFGKAAEKQAEDALQRVLASSCTGGSA